MPERDARHFDDIWKQLGIPPLPQGWPQLNSSNPEFQARQRAFHVRCSQPKPGTLEEITAALCDLHDFVVWARMGASGGTGDGHIHFLRFVLQRRCRCVVEGLTKQRPPRWEKAMQLIRWAYEHHWPHNFCGLVFAQLWGFLQLELEKPEKMVIQKCRQTHSMPYGRLLLSADLPTCNGGFTSGD